MKGFHCPKAMALLLLYAVPFLCNGASRASNENCQNECKERKALLGDGSVAYELGNGFLYTDRNKMKYWYRISAENGSISGQYNYAHFLTIDSTGPEDCYRAIFWFGVAAKGGDKESKGNLKKLISAMNRGDTFSGGCLAAYNK